MNDSTTQQPNDPDSKELGISSLTNSIEGLSDLVNLKAKHIEQELSKKYGTNLHCGQPCLR
ncbi:hypothetical protein [Planctobacterium marinum]|uniref:Uncharacterized protein n=1 Tax=Planctobacterium marinum TaxID=1631968 RepID=A0AA48HY29_9ALTE|nr:hypothetical protein MACH26_22360 [Planctobacterium marinum]